MIAVDWEGGITEAWNGVASFVPKLVGFLVILGIGFFVAKMLARLADALLERVGFDRWVERGSLKTALARSKVDASDVMGMVVFWAIFLLTLQLAFGVFGPNPVSDLIEGLVAYLPKVFAAVLILVIAAALARVVTDILQATIGAISAGRTIAQVAGAAILIVGVFAALDQLEIAPAIVNGLFYALLVAIVGSAVVAFGGGGIPVARRYLERWSSSADATAEEVRRAARGRNVEPPERIDLTEEQPAAGPRTTR